MAEDESPGHRAFLALWPDDLTRERLLREGRKLHDVFGGRLAIRQSIHMTLVFLGDVSAQQSQQIGLIAQNAKLRSFSLHMVAAGCWAHNRIAWLAPALTPEPLAQLITDLRRTLSEAGLRVESRPFTPHVTLLRRAQCRPISIQVQPFEWRVQDFVLVHSQLNSDAAQYDVVGRWTATDADGTAVL